jgi:hypothetical protein
VVSPHDRYSMEEWVTAILVISYLGHGVITSADTIARDRSMRKVLR